MEFPVIFNFDFKYVTMWIASIYSMVNSVMIFIFMRREHRSKVGAYFLASFGLVLPFIFIIGSFRWYVIGYYDHILFIDEMFWSIYHLSVLVFFSLQTSFYLNSLLKIKRW